MNKNLKKVLIVGIPTAIAAALVYAWWKSTQPKPTLITNNPATTPPLTVSPSRLSGNFPLQQGSRGDLVKQLQNALGITADGVFGPQTQSALQANTGLSTVPDQNTLTAIINTTGPNGTKIIDLGQTLIAQFQEGGVDIMATQDQDAAQVTQDSSGVSTPTGQSFHMTRQQSYDNTIYQLTGATTLAGQLVMRALSGPLQGIFVLDPTKIGMSVHTAAPASLTPSYNPSTGLTSF